MNPTLNQTLDFIRQYCLRYTPEKPAIQYRESLAKGRVRFVVSFKEQAGNQMVVRSVMFDIGLDIFTRDDRLAAMVVVRKIIHYAMLKFLKKVKEGR